MERILSKGYYFKYLFQGRIQEPQSYLGQSHFDILTNNICLGRSSLERVSQRDWRSRTRARMFALWKQSSAAAHSITTGCLRTGSRCEHDICLISV